jgi:hypothetical protein
MKQVFSGVDQALNELSEEMLEDQRVWIIERSASGFWGIAIVRDLPEDEWKIPSDGTPIVASDTYRAVAYRRDLDLAVAVRDVTVQLRGLNADRSDASAEQKFLQSIKEDLVSDAAKELKS